jgi:hypothetical protein
MVTTKGDAAGEKGLSEGEIAAVASSGKGGGAGP